MSSPGEPDAVSAVIRNLLAELLGVPLADIADDRSFRAHGLDSSATVELGARLSLWLGRPVPVSMLWRHPTITALARHVTLGPQNRDASHMSTRVVSAEPEAIAIVGLGCRLPRSIDTPSAYWEALLARINAVRDVPPERWTADEHQRRGAFLDDVATFDAAFFGIAPVEARQMDPQQRIALEVAAAALEDARIVASDLVGTRTGVFVGAMWQDYHRLGGDDVTAIRPHTLTGSDISILAGRIAYTLGLQGPALTVNTACSSALLAIHLAMESLRSGGSDIALAGGVSLMLHSHTAAVVSRLGVLSPNGQCRTFDAGADGYARGEGCGIVVLRRLSDALVAGDRIYAVLRGSSVNNDGASNGLTAPNPQAQIDVLRSAWHEAGVIPQDVSYVEAHGTGTALGDPIEAGALTAVFGGPRENALLIGSVKTNIGHLEPAAGVASVMKVALALHNDELPASLNFATPNPHIDFAAGQLEVVEERRAWPAMRRRYAGVSSFGFGGTNVHVAIEEAPYKRGRRALPSTTSARPEKPELVFFFSGGGSDWIGMARDLMVGEPAFRAALLACDEAIREVTGWSVMRELVKDRASSRLHLTSVVQPALFAIHVALARTLQAWGLVPDAVFGKSIGEVAAAVIAGALTINEGARVISLWSQLVTERADGLGAMAVCDVSLAEAEAIVAARGDGICVAAHLSPDHICLAGPLAAIERLETELAARGTRAQRVNVAYAGHSDSMAVMLDELAVRLGTVERRATTIPMWSTVVNRVIAGDELDARYWGANMQRPILLTESVDALTRGKNIRIVELAPHPVAVRSIAATLRAQPAGRSTVIATCRRETSSRQCLEDLVEALWADGFDIDWDAVAGRSSQTPFPTCLVVSGKSDAALRDNCLRLAAHLETGTDDLTDVALTLATARVHFDVRAAVVASTVDEAVAGLRAASTSGGTKAPSGAKLAVLFTGQGSQRAEMGRRLYAVQPAFRDALDAVFAVLDIHLNVPLATVMFAPAGSAQAALLHRTEYAQPALFALEVALYRQWEAWGVTPSAVAGHSVGELAAAHVAGVMSLGDAAMLVCARGRLMQSCESGGAMMSIEASEDEVRSALTGRISIAGLNGPRQTVVSGDAAAVDAVAAVFSPRGRRTRRLTVSHAFHSPHMDAMLAEYEAVAARCTFTAPRLRFVSGVDTSSDVTSPAYWVRHARDAVRFVDVMTALAREGIRHYLECGPSGVLSAMGAECVEDATFVASLRTDDECASLAHAAGALHIAGHVLDWKRVSPGGRLVDLPTYAFQRERYWLDTKTSRFDAESLGLEASEHPWLTASTALADGGHLFAGHLSLADHAWLRDHEVLGQALLPGAAIVELALTVGRAVSAERVIELTLVSPLVLPDGDRAVRLQVTVGLPDERGHRSFALYSQQEKASSWTQHATADLAPSTASTPADELERLRVWPVPGTEPVDLHGFYERLRDRGFAYGPAFQGLAELRRDGEYTYGRIVLPKVVSDGATQFGLHPVLLDAALHTMMDAVAMTSDGGVLLPFGWSDVVQYATGASELRVTMRVTSPDRVTLFVADGNGQPVACVGGLQLRAASREQMRRTQRVDHLYRVDFQPMGLADDSSLDDVLVLGPATGLAAVLGLEAVLSLDALVKRMAVPPRHLVIDATNGSHGSASAQRMAVDALTLLQSLLSETSLASMELVWVTRNAIGASVEDRVDDLAHAPLWGLIRTARNEHPDRVLRLVDLGMETDAAVLRRTVITNEPEVVVRGGQLLVARLTQARAGLEVPASGAWQLELAERGRLDRLRVVSLATEPLRDGEVRVRVCASGVNFRDVMNALDMVPAPQLGLECAGVIVDVGTGVDPMRVGERVMGLAMGTFGNEVVTDARLLVAIPSGIPFAEAATMPIAFLTALYAFEDLGALRAGENVLIHAAAGGVGMAAVQLARHRGANVFATASPGKWGVLRGLGLTDDRIASSRDLVFATTFAAHGMDVVLNSLAGEYIDASLRLMPSGGRFVEMGKTDVRGASAMPSGVTYHAFDLMDVGPDRLGAMLAEIARLLAAGAVTALPHVAYDVRHLSSALRWMAQAKHVGKIVVTTPQLLDRDASVLITGGTGELGQAVAEHLVRTHGVRHLVLTSRRGAEAPGTTTLVSRLEQAGARTARVVACDVANRDDVAAVLAGADRWTAVLHLAGVIDDGLVEAQTADRFVGVMAPKIAGALHLHELTRDMDLAAFVMFSSVSGVMGSAGQSTYAAANVFLDALAVHRHTRGLPAKSLAWGLWEQAGVGMTAHLGAAELARLRRGGIVPMSVTDGLRLLDAALARPDAQLVPITLQLEALHGEAPALMRSLVRPRLRQARGSIPPVSALRDQLSGLSEIDRLRTLTQFVQREVTAVLGLSGSDAVPTDRALRDLGLDSLMSVELGNRLAKQAQTPLPPTLVFDYPTPVAIARLLDQRLVPQQVVTLPKPRGTMPSRSPSLDVENLSIDELHDALDAELRMSGLAVDDSGEGSHE